MPPRYLSPLIGLGVPSAAILVVMPFIADTSVLVLGVPLVFFWIFLWIPLTSLCLWVAWHFVDAPRMLGATADAEEAGR